ncbi:MAG: cytochrome P450 [Anaerolineales bacterium]|nr:cytochrome P450 [Anaerolineales bacterium]
MNACPSLSDLPLPPGAFGLPLIGETIEFARDPAQFTAVRRAKYGPVFCTHIIGAKTIFLTDKDALRWIFANEGKTVENLWNKSTRDLLGEQCVAMLTGDEHRQRRQALMPHFKQGALQDFTPTMQAITARHLAEWATRPGAIVLLDEMQALVFDIIIAFLFGTTETETSQIDVPYLSYYFRRWTRGLVSVPVRLPFSPYSRALSANKKLRRAIGDIVRRRRAQLASGALPPGPPDLLTTLLTTADHSGQPLSDEAIGHDLQNQLFAGHDTTVTVLVNLMLLLAQHTAVWNRAQAEIDTANLQTDPFNQAELRRLPYLNHVLDESMRAVTPVGGTFRVLLQDVAYQGYRLPQGWKIRLEIAGQHHNPEIWTEPEKFDPERWAHGREEQKNWPLSYIPFGGGPRICLGANLAMAEMRLTLAMLLQQYEWELVPDQNLTYDYLPFPRPQSGVRVYFRQRESRPAAKLV